MTEQVRERYLLGAQRIAQIPEETGVPCPYRDFFVCTAKFIGDAFSVYELVQAGELEKLPLSKIEEINYRLYEDILPENYEQSYGNPDYAAKELGVETGVLLSFLYTELRGMAGWAFEGKIWDMTVAAELFLEVYGAFEGAEEACPVRALKEILYWYISDYCEEMVAERIEESVNPDVSFAADIILHADLSDLRYLYRFGEYITENEKKTAQFLNGLSQEEIDAMARTYTEGYRIGFVVGKKDLSKKETVNIRYTLGFERIVRAAILQFAQMGLRPVIYRAALHAINKRQHSRIGYFGAIPNKQYDYDHRNDAALYLDEDMLKRKLRSLQIAYEHRKELAAVHAGPAVMEIFGEKPFTPQARESASRLSKYQQKLQVQYANESGQITNRYIPGEERSFTIIAWPIPEIGENFEAIFRETVKINTLDYQLYQRIQQCIIDTLDLGEAVEIRGMGANRTDLTVTLHTLRAPEQETNFENCVADVNIPVGEVFTSPVLAGTNGVLHVSSVYLNELQYKDLEIAFKDGMIADYTCKNFEKEEENRSYIRENVLHHHETLPMGEFAIGTNTTAYRAAQQYRIADKLPILIAEKMGPHFAVGDTCYSWSEDTAVFNPDGKEIIARDNEVSILRREDVSKAYMGCHTDITIPYDELGSIRVVCPGGTRISIIENGKFVLEGTEELNVPLEETRN